MSSPARETLPAGYKVQRLLAYIADLELDVDRLRKQSHFVHHEVREALRIIQLLCGGTPAAPGAAPLTEIAQTAKHLAQVLSEMRESPGYHPAHDQVVAIAVRPLIEQVFRWQQRLAKAQEVSLRLKLETDHVEWFPSRLRHILDNLIFHALKSCDASKCAAWVELGLRESETGYEFRVSDNGQGLHPAELEDVFELFYRSAPARAAGLGLGLSVVKLLVEQSGGTVTADSGAGQGSTFVVRLPRYEVDDFLV